LLIGVEAAQGVSTAIPGIPLTNPDAEKLRLEQILASQLDPRLPRVDIETIDCGSGRHVLAIRVARSWIAPHRVLANDKFYGRNSGGNYELDVGELRSAFVLSESSAERIRNFRDDRLIKIAAGETPLAMHPGAAMIVHVVPFSTFVAGRSLDIVQAIGAGYVMALPPGRIGHPNNYATNLDGLVTYSNAPDDPAHGYAQVFRSGAVEGVDLLGTDEKEGAPYLEELVPLAEQLLDVPQDLIRTALDLELADGTVIANRVGDKPCVFLANLMAPPALAGLRKKLNA
jgi:hypothetical protein